ncbi:hypothetical protein FLONG3_3677 [Fusarium longipes]|uniref:Uncharacterized protein n=1 Tax=Fusarium longipes TaxID=694270 RepID=A0A395T0G6_9HYPO|nr:hypothetical protein FLONG3_3677 [Fusarium longipes]
MNRNQPDLSELWALLEKYLGRKDPGDLPGGYITSAEIDAALGNSSDRGQAVTDDQVWPTYEDNPSGLLTPPPSP